MDVPEDVEIEIVASPITEKELMEDLKTEYTLTIHYVYEDGTPACNDYTAVIPYGTPYDIASPHIDQYTPSQDRVNDIMPKCNVSYTVIYIALNTEKIIDINDYYTPLGLGFLNMNMGVQFE